MTDLDVGADRGEALSRFEWLEIQRATDSATTCGNEIRLHFEGSTTFSTWIEQIEAAERFVYFENYLVRDDETGRRLRDALVLKSREGVPVYALYDWMGCWATPRRFWKPLREAGVQVRAFNGPRRALAHPFGALQRDHRKLVVVDGEIAHVSGMCVGDEWAGTREAPPWRDTGVELRGPAALAAAHAFEGLWRRIGGEIDAAPALGAPSGRPVPAWLIEGEPGRARVYRTLSHAVSRARESIWITDAYFVAPRPLSEALAAAAEQGVDVRIIVPAHNNWPIVGSLSRGGYRFLVERGVRIFEWQGPMIHAKTSVVDGVWCRVGSSNLNAASLMGNWELDVGVLDPDLGQQLRGLFLADLTSCVEIVLPGRQAPSDERGRVLNERTTSLDPEGTLPERIEQEWKDPAPSRGVSLASVVRASGSLGDALAGDRPLGREDRTVLGTLSIAILVLAGVAFFAPLVIGWVVAIVAAWVGIVTGVKAYAQSRRARLEERMSRPTAEENRSGE